MPGPVPGYGGDRSAGLCAGAVVGVVTVLLAAQAPAKRAAKVSPMAAVSGSTQNVPVGRAAHAGKGRVELALGVRHATASKKNWVRWARLLFMLPEIISTPASSTSTNSTAAIPYTV